MKRLQKQYNFSFATVFQQPQKLQCQNLGEELCSLAPSEVTIFHYCFSPCKREPRGTRFSCRCPPMKPRGRRSRSCRRLGWRCQKWGERLWTCPLGVVGVVGATREAKSFARLPWWRLQKAAKTQSAEWMTEGILWNLIDPTEQYIRISMAFLPVIVHLTLLYFLGTLVRTIQVPDCALWWMLAS